MLFEGMSKMTSSVDDVDILKKESLNQEEIYGKWWHSKFEEDEAIIKQNEKDNIFYIDKRTWNEKITKKINIEVNGKNLG
jgi:hypothetical protein